jgi:hypothetical protein
VKFKLVTSMYVFVYIILFCKPPYKFLHCSNKLYQNNNITPFNFSVIGSSRKVEFANGDFELLFGRLCGIRLEDGTVFRRLSR